MLFKQVVLCCAVNLQVQVCLVSQNRQVSAVEVFLFGLATRKDAARHRAKQKEKKGEIEGEETMYRIRERREKGGRNRRQVRRYRTNSKEMKI